MTLFERHLYFGGYVVLLCVLHRWTLAELLVMGRADATASHLLLVPLVTLGLLYMARESVFATVRFEPLGGAFVIALGLLVWLGATGQPGPGGRSLAALSLVMLWQGGFVLVYGRRAFAEALFPLLFLAFTVPFPTFVIGPTVTFLKVGSAEAVDVLFRITGTPFYREGFTFALPTVAIEVADACSGIRSSIGLLLTSLLAGYLFLQTSWKRVVLVGAIVPLVIVKNAIRIVTLSLLSIHVDPGFLDGQLHHEGGIVFFLLALVMLAPILAWLQRSESATVVADIGRSFR